MDVTETAPGRAEVRIEGVAIGRLVRAGDRAECLVDYPGNPGGGPVAALATVPSGESDVGREVALAFEGGDPGRPIVLGFIHHPQAPGEVQVEEAPDEDAEGAPSADDVNAEAADVVTAEAEGGVSAEMAGGVDARVDGERLVLTAEREIVLRCGKASLTLTRAGKVILRGKYVLSRSSGVNRIKGGSVQIN